jgi:uridine phosphorylase
MSSIGRPSNGAAPPRQAVGARPRRSRYPILEHDPDPHAVLEPKDEVRPLEVGGSCVLCFFQDVIRRVCGPSSARLVTTLRSELGSQPVYEIEHGGQRVGVAHPGIGAPMAAATLEELIALGYRKFIVCGGAGVLDGALRVGRVLVPVAAVRDEGTSYHYLPPSRETYPAPEAVRAIETVLHAHGVDYVAVKTWTTDAYYRETAAKVRRRRAQGCRCVEMEAAALFAVAEFRAAPLGQLLYAGDDVSGSEWDSRHWDDRASVREGLFWLAAEACLAL